MRSSQENLKPRPCYIDRAIARSTRQARLCGFSRKDQTFQVNKLFITAVHVQCICLFAMFLQARNRPMDNNAQELTSARYIRNKSSHTINDFTLEYKHV